TGARAAGSPPRAGRQPTHPQLCVPHVRGPARRPAGTGDPVRPFIRPVPTIEPLRLLSLRSGETRVVVHGFGRYRPGGAARPRSSERQAVRVLRPGRWGEREVRDKLGTIMRRLPRPIVRGCQARSRNTRRMVATGAHGG